MDVPASKSIKLVGRWAMGSMFFCEHYSSPDMVPSDAVVQWADNGAILCLRPQDPALTSEAAGWAQAGKLVSTTSYGIWHITPETYVKVVSWQEGAQLEGRTVKFINDKHPEIPTTRVIYEWIDPTWTRTFMIMKRAWGVLMAEALVYMDDSQVKDVADQVAAHVKTLTQHTSNMLETLDQHGVQETRLVGWFPLKDVPHSESWKQFQWPRFSQEGFKTHLKESSNMTLIPDSGPEFVLYNSKLTTRNIFVYPPLPGEKGRLAEIINWDFTAYWPRYWVATCPNPDGAFITDITDYGSKLDVRWPQFLRKALMQLGFENVGAWWDSYRFSSEDLRSERAGKEYRDWVAVVREESIRLNNLRLGNQSESSS